MHPPAFQPTIFHIVYGLKYKRSLRIQLLRNGLFHCHRFSEKRLHFAASFIILQTFFDFILPNDLFSFVETYLCFKFKQLMEKMELKVEFNKVFGFFFQI